jgi:hypothetical protein
MTKAFIAAAALAILADDEKPSSEKPLGEDETVPMFSRSDTELENKSLYVVNLIELLAHRLVVDMRQSY